MTAIRISVRGDREVRQLLDSLSGRELVTRTRRGTRAGVAIMRPHLRSRARNGQYPRSFSKIATKSSTHGGIRTSIGPTSPLHVIFEGGAGLHPIGAPGQLLVNPAEGFIAHGPVHHPGMAARPLTTPVFEADKDRAADAAMGKILEGLR